MHLSFYKYQGTGNDFIIVDNREDILHAYSTQLVQELCDRRFGIGADGLMVIKNHREYDFEMVYHNADGSQSFCGNGSRCAEAYFLTTDGPHQASIKEDLIHLQLRDVSEIRILKDGYLLNTGSPHYVKHIDDWKDLNVYEAGKQIRNTLPFQKEGVNVNFVSLEQDNKLIVRTYERGVEDETLSCGTGVVAAALIAATKGHTSPITIHTTKKNHHHFQDIQLIGPARMVFKGEVDCNA